MPTLQDGKSAIEQGNLQQARLIFQAILQENPRSEEAWLGLAQVVTETNDKRVCYENVLKINRNNKEAKEGLRGLEPQEDPLVAALAGPTKSRTAEEAVEDEPTIVSEEAAPSFEPEEERETPVSVLVVIGLALSVVLFAIFGGIIFYAITSLSGG